MDERHEIEFRDEYQKLTFSVLQAYREIQNYFSHKLKAYKISLQQYLILKALKRNYPEKVNINFLSNCMPDKRSDVSRLVERLRVLDLVDRMVCPNDRRKAEVVLTENGYELIKKIESKEEKWERELYKISENEAKKFNEILKKIG